MNVWYHRTAIFKQRHGLRIAGLLALCVALTTTLIFNTALFAAPGVNQTLGFQGRLAHANGGVVPDGYYNIQFKIYEGGGGNTVGNPGGTLKWTENYVNNNAEGGIYVKNGYFSVSLGSQNPFGSSVDWNQDTLWLSLNVAGSAANCTTFGSGACTADGEMLPMKRLTSVPYSLNSGMVGGKTADNLVQLAQGVQTDSSIGTSSIFINKTGSDGNFLRLQAGGEDVFRLDTTGNVVFGGNDNRQISVATSDQDTAGGNLTMRAGTGGDGDGSNGGTLVMQGGDAGGTNGNGGNVEIDAGAGNGTGTDGAIAIGSARASSITIGSQTGSIAQDISIGSNGTAGSTSNVTVGAGAGAAAGTTTVQAKDAVTISVDGTTQATFSGANTVHFGNGVAADAPNDYTIQGTNSTTSAAGGTLTVQGGNAQASNGNGGNLILGGGTGNGTGSDGLVVLKTPTFATVMNDANCYTGGAIVASTCTITGSSVNGSSAIIIGFSTAGQTATLPDPANMTAGRVLYIVAAGNSEDFSLSYNGGGAGNRTTMRKNSSTSVIWNGSDWVSVGASSTTTIQDAYENSSQTAGGPEVIASASGGGVSIRNDSNEPIDGSIFTVKSSSNTALFSVNETTESNPESTAPNVQVGSGSGGGTGPTLFKLDKAASAPSGTAGALLGSMYYDTTLGKVQCYESEGWGACGASPDTFITISPEYTNAVMNGADIGTISSDLCSDALNINDGSSSQPSICGTNETQNFYKWTSAESTDQTRSIFVTYQLPATFKSFVSGSTSLMGRTNDTNATVGYQIYRDDGENGLVSCGSAVTVSTGAQTTWQKVAASGSADPANCNFSAGDSILIRINLTAKSNANAYVSDLGFTFNNN